MSTFDQALNQLYDALIKITRKLPMQQHARFASQILSSALFLFCCDLVAIVGTGGWPRSAGGIVELIDTENWSSMQGDIYEGLLAKSGNGKKKNTNLH